MTERFVSPVRFERLPAWKKAWKTPYTTPRITLTSASPTMTSTSV
jgi:hypothetical protein